MPISKRAALALAVALVAGCQQSESEDRNVQEPSMPIGSIVGRVTSLRTGGALAGVKVTATSPGGVKTATTDGGGTYTLGGLPAGAAYEVRFELDGYVTSRGAAGIPDTVGDYPQGNGTVVLDAALAQPDATVKGTIIAYAGLPAAGAVVRADLRGLGFDLVKEVTTDAAGGYQIAGLPGSPTGLVVPLSVAPFDADADGMPDYGPYSGTVRTYPAATSLDDLDLRTVAYGLQLVTSDVESGIHDPATALHFTFNRDLAATTAATLRDDTAGLYVAVLPSTSGGILQVATAGGTPLATAHAFTVTIYGVADNGALATITRTFQAVAGGGLLAAPALTISPASADYNTSSFTLSWPAVAGAYAYRVYARDTHANPSYLLLSTVGTSPSPRTTIGLPTSFDWYSSDGILTPFLSGTKVDFVVVPVNAYGDTIDPATPTPVSRTDVIAPTGASAQTGNANNSAGTAAKTVSLAITFSEYMDTSVLPTVTFSDVTVTASTFVYDATTKSGTLSVTIPAGLNAVGVTYSISGAKDTSGNTQATLNDTLSGVSQAIVNGGFESGSLAPWSTSFSSTSTAPILSSTFAYSGTYSLALGNFTALAESGTSAAWQDVAIPAGATSISVSARYWSQTNYPSSYHDYNVCEIRTTAGGTIATLFSTYAASTAWSSASTTVSSAYAGQTIRVYCYTSQDGAHITGMYLDDVSVNVTQ